MEEHEKGGRHAVRLLMGNAFETDKQLGMSDETEAEARRVIEAWKREGYGCDVVVYECEDGWWRIRLERRLRKEGEPQIRVVSEGETITR
jgi:hypothetical protein